MKNPLSLEAFLDFCRKQPAARDYVYPDSGRCACQQYFQSMGLPYKFTENYQARPEWEELAKGNGRSSWTFGALADRIEKRLADA